MRALGFVLGIVAMTTAACTVVSEDKGASDPSSPSPSSSDASTPPSADGGTVPPSSTPPASATEANVTIDDACPAFAACGGSPQGTYDYTGGCLGDRFADAKAQCPSLDTSNAKVTVRGSITFSGNALTRDITSKVSGSIFFPQSCSMGQCAMVESGLQSAFTTASCTAKNGGCDCAISRTDTGKNVTTYTLAGSTVTTADDETYEICEKAGALTYEGKSAGSEDGVWSLKKR